MAAQFVEARRSRGIFLLAFVAGTLDTAAFFRGLTFCTGMSGNLLNLGYNAAFRETYAAIYYSVVLVTYYVGSLASHVLFRRCQRRTAVWLVVVNTVISIIVSELINYELHLPVWPHRRVHWSIVLLVWAVSFHNEYAQSVYGFGNVNLITVNSSKALNALVDHGRPDATCVLQLSMVAGFAMGIGWMSAYNGLTPGRNGQHVWISTVAAGVTLVNAAIDERWPPRADGAEAKPLIAQT